MRKENVENSNSDKINGKSECIINNLNKGTTWTKLTL